MSIFHSIGTTLAGLAHDVVDAIGNDDSKGRQIVRDAQEHSREAEHAGVDVEVTLQLEKNKYAALVTESNSWKAKASKALDANDEPLALEILARKATIDTQVAASKARLDVLEPQVLAMKERIAQAVEMNSHTAEKVALASANAKIADASLAAASVVAGIGDGTDVAADVARMQAKSDEKMARAQVLGQHADAATGNDLDARIAGLGQATATDALAALKAERAGSAK